MSAALLNLESFRLKIRTFINQADERGRGDDLDRIAAHVEKAEHPDEVTKLAAITYLVDQEFLLPLQEAIDAHRRWRESKGEPISDDEIYTLMRQVYGEVRA